MPTSHKLWGKHSAGRGELGARLIGLERGVARTQSNQTRIYNPFPIPYAITHNLFSRMNTCTSPPSPDTYTSVGVRRNPSYQPIPSNSPQSRPKAASISSPIPSFPGDTPSPIPISLHQKTAKIVRCLNERRFTFPFTPCGMCVLACQQSIDMLGFLAILGRRVNKRRVSKCTQLPGGIEKLRSCPRRARFLYQRICTATGMITRR